MYAVVDIETTGGNARDGKITEIAIFVHDGKKVIDQFVSLINPECTIPPFITDLTGITNEMTKDAPKFYEVAKKVVEITEGHIFMAHNVGFDYGFIQSEFKSLGFDYVRDTLCSARLSKKILTGLSSYGLGSLCKHLGIEINGRHRAGGDAYATTKVLDVLLTRYDEDIFQSLLTRRVIPDQVNQFLKKQDIEGLPASSGVYIFRDNIGQPLYIEASDNIASQAINQILNPRKKKEIQMIEEVASVDFEITGSELVASLKKADEIRRNRPKYNGSGTNKYGIFAEYQIDGVTHLAVYPAKGRTDDLVSFSSKTAAEEFLLKIVRKYRLCPQKTGFERNTMSTACKNHLINLCDGVCCHKESVHSYNERVADTIRNMLFDQSNFLILDKGRTSNERAIIKVENGSFSGFGYVDIDLEQQSIELLKDIANSGMKGREGTMIIHDYLNNRRVQQIINF